MLDSDISRRVKMTDQFRQLLHRSGGPYSGSPAGQKRNIWKEGWHNSQTPSPEKPAKTNKKPRFAQTTANSSIGRFPKVGENTTSITRTNSTTVAKSSGLSNSGGATTKKGGGSSTSPRGEAPNHKHSQAQKPIVDTTGLSNLKLGAKKQNNALSQNSEEKRWGQLTHGIKLTHGNIVLPFFHNKYSSKLYEPVLLTMVSGRYLVLVPIG